MWELHEDFSRWQSSTFHKACYIAEGSPEDINWPEKYRDYPHPDCSFQNEDELDQYYDILLDTLHLSKLRADSRIQRPNSGSGEPLKGGPHGTVSKIEEGHL